MTGVETCPVSAGYGEDATKVTDRIIDSHVVKICPSLPYLPSMGRYDFNEDERKRTAGVWAVVDEQDVTVRFTSARTFQLPRGSTSA